MGAGPRLYIDMGYVRAVLDAMAKSVAEHSGSTAYAYPEWDGIIEASTRGLICRSIKVYDAAPASGAPGRYAHAWRWLEGREFVKLKIRQSLEPPYYTQKEVDVDLATDMLSDAIEGKADWFVLLSADRDFIPLVEKVKEHGRQVRIVQFARTAPGVALARAGNDLVDLDAQTVLQLQVFKQRIRESDQ